jgi:cyclophilin family peptidyl-prolyl cis-trans isomerase/HEAT repeat protein
MTATRRHFVTSAATQALALIAAGCASAPPAPSAPVVSFDRKMAAILQLEDQRVLRVELPPPPVVAPPRRGRPAAAPPPPFVPDLSALVADAEPRVRRRAALAIGRVGLREGVQPLAGALADPDAEVRAMAAFALGFIGDPGASPQLVTALSDAAPLVRGRAAEALGLLNAKDSAAAIGRMAAEYGRSPAVAALRGDDETMPVAPEADAFRLGLYALVRLRVYEPLAAAALDASGRPVSTWWPVAYALQRIGDPRALAPLQPLLRAPGKYTPAFAARGLGALKDGSSVEALAALVEGAQTPFEVRVSAVRALAQIADPRGAAALVRLLSQPSVDRNLELEAVTALGILRAADGLPVIQDLLTDPWPVLRAAALRAAAAIDQESFVLVLSSLDRDPHWSVRAALADVLASFPPDLARPRVQAMLQDEDKRVLPSVVRALVRLGAPEAASIALEHLKESDFAVRAAMAAIVGQVKPAGGAEALRAAYLAALPDSAYDARAAALSALAEYGAAEATETVKAALADKDWAVRLRAVALLATLDPSGDFRLAIRPAPGAPSVPYNDARLVAPPFSPHVFIETAKGTIEFELAVLDAPQTSANFMALARKGFFNGLQIHRVVPNFVVQDGDPRGDGEGGPGYTIRDELNERPFLRGTVGMALAGPDTGGSQFFIVHSPQPHLDAKYTVFGHVVNGMGVVDRIQQGDTIQRIRVWDGQSMQ